MKGKNILSTTKKERRKRKKIIYISSSRGIAIMIKNMGRIAWYKSIILFWHHNHHHHLMIIFNLYIMFYRYKCNTYTHLMYDMLSSVSFLYCSYFDVSNSCCFSKEISWFLIIHTNKTLDIQLYTNILVIISLCNL